MSNKSLPLIDHVSDLWVFVRVVETQNFTRAAELLGLSRSAIGKSIVRLESRLQTRLLHRTTRQVSVSDEGAVFYQHALRILAEVADAEAVLLQRQLSPNGRLRLAVPATFGRLQVLPIVTAYLAKYPEVSVEVIFADRYHDLIGEGIDVAVRIGGEVDSGLRQRVLAPHRLVTCASPAYLAQYGAPQTPADLAQHEAIVYMHSGRAVAWRFDQAGSDATVAVQGRLRLDSVEAMQAAAESGLGVIQAGAYLVAGAVQAGHLVPILEGHAAIGAPVCAVYPSRHHLTPKVRCFIDMLVTAWQPQPPWLMAPMRAQKSEA
ncbi:LysR family transcriptional regulator [Neisseriaceae bacterium CLB008]|nr:LysR family transcriptional regulator [Neisseriaceae bacterium]